MLSKRIFQISSVLVWVIASSNSVSCQDRKDNIQPMESKIVVENRSHGLAIFLVKRSLQHDEFQRDVIAKVQALPISKLNKYKLEAALHLKTNLERSFRILSSNVEYVPNGVRVAARKVLVATHSGRLTQAIIKNLAVILKKASHQQGRPAEQLQTIIATIVPDVPVGAKNHLRGILGFVSSNLSIVNTLLARVLGSVPNLLAGVINSLTNNLGAVTEAVNGTLATLGVLLGGILG